MRVKVKWLGFHDDCYHESDVFETSKQVKDFISLLGSPEDSTASLVNADTGENILFSDFL